MLFVSFNTFMVDFGIISPVFLSSHSHNKMEWSMQRTATSLKLLVIRCSKWTKNFCTNAIFKDCYLINRMSSYMLDGKYNNSFLCHQEYLFQLPSHKFEFIWFVHQLHPHMVYLNPRAHVFSSDILALKRV